MYLGCGYLAISGDGHTGTSLQFPLIHESESMNTGRCILGCLSVVAITMNVHVNALAQDPAFYTDAAARKIERSGWLPVWPEAGPEETNGLTGPEADGGCTGNISVAEIFVSLPEQSTPIPESGRQAIVITPGGGYGVVCERSEGTEIAKLLNPLGVAAIVVKYRLPNQHHRIPAEDVRRAIRIVRHNAKAWQIDPNRVGLWGFSAGGHLCSTVSNANDRGSGEAADPIERQSSRPDFSVLFYPVISMEQGVTHSGSRRNLLGESPTEEMVGRYSNDLRVSKSTPPTFLLHAADDKVVLVENSLRYYRQLVEHDVPARMVMFETGGHGPGAFRSNPSWLGVFQEWLKKH